MKTGAKKRRAGLFFFIAASALAAAPFLGCGSSNEKAPVGDGDMSAMKGFAAFGTQCVSGFNTDPKAVKLELWSCPTGLKTLELAEPIQPLYFSADCGRKALTIRSYDRSVNANWELMPDGTFYITQDGLNAKLKDDGAGDPNCSTPLSMDLWGQVDCTSQNTDQAKIHFETVMWLNKETVSAPSAISSAPSAPAPQPLASLRQRRLHRPRARSRAHNAGFRPSATSMRSPR